jgi:hypothetical protein
MGPIPRRKRFYLRSNRRQRSTMDSAGEPAVRMPRYAQLRLGRSQTAAAQAVSVTPMAEPIEGGQPLAKYAVPGWACGTGLDAGRATAHPLR